MLAASGVPSSRCVPVVTVRDSEVASLQKCDQLGLPYQADYGPPNIHRWWNRGIDYAELYGADIVIVVNDDIVCHEPLTKLAAAIRATGATLAQPATPAMTGWCFALNLAHGIRPDDRYQWWFGDNDLWLRAKREGKGVVSVPVAIQHLPRPGGYAALTDWQEPLVAADRARFLAQYSAAPALP